MSGKYPELDDIEIHPAANLFPMMTDAELADLMKDIQAKGQHVECEIYDGKLIDGRNRWVACKRLGIEPATNEPWLANDSEAVAYVLSHNLHRRHLTASQRAMVAAGVENLFAADAKGRSAENLKKGNVSPEVVNLPPRGGAGKKSRDKAAEALGVSGKSVSDAKAVIEHGSPELIDAVNAGQVSVSKAAKVARVSPPEIQMDEINGRPEATASPEAHDATEATGPDLIKELDAPVRSFVLKFSRLLSEFDEFTKSNRFTKEFYAHNEREAFRIALDRAKGVITASRPHATCEDCHGKGCETCSNAGALPRNLYQQATGK